MASDKPWDGAASNYASSEAYCAACLLDLNKPGEKKTQDQCHLPVFEPGGALNKNALSAAAGRLMQTKVSPDDKKKAARKLKRMYAEAKMTPPDSLKNMAM